MHGPHRSQIGEATYRTLEQWQDVIKQHYPLHLGALRPDGPPVILARMLAEGTFRQVLSTNWDSYVELGAWLVGMGVHNSRTKAIKDSGKQTLQVYDTGRDVSLFPRLCQMPVLLKIHGGVDHVANVLTRLANGCLTEVQAERQLRESFLVSATDLTHWREAAQWVQDAVSDVLRGHRVFFLGVSGGDTVSFRAVRSRVQEWEHSALAWNEEQRSLPSRESDPEPDPLPLVAITRDQSLRLACMFSVSSARGLPRVHVISGDGGFALRAAYAWSMMQKLLEALEPELPMHRRLREELSTRLTLEVNAKQEEKNEAPLLALLCDALGPNARWAALAEGRPPFDSLPLEPQSRWWYAPWFRFLVNDPPPSQKALQQIAACAAWLTRSRPGYTNSSIKVDPWTGVVQLTYGSDPTNAGANDDDPTVESCAAWLSTSDLLLLPWPWQPRLGVNSQELHRALKRNLHWLPGRSLAWLASPRLSLIPVGDVESRALFSPPAMKKSGTADKETDQETRLEARRAIPLASGWSLLRDPINWLQLCAEAGED